MVAETATSGFPTKIRLPLENIALSIVRWATLSYLCQRLCLISVSNLIISANPKKLIPLIKLMAQYVKA